MQLSEIGYFHDRMAEYPSNSQFDTKEGGKVSLARISIAGSLSSSPHGWVSGVPRQTHLAPN
ncbi:MAG: hypothetical protein Q8R93_05135 [Methylicorpusculum sp.]|uniref:hypothetical protein n=1 Tax=Methylicorpusculum sp. TaxID=2713644 RepID=UPI0027314FAA|nr:hypothetical protein [Methylicorpusculum sp.]MDP3528678.1 hypothetical protein [Methylicorpusculum sp.]